MRFYVAAFLVFCSYFGITVACTGILIMSKDGAVITGRTLEFAKDIDSRLIAVPKGYRYVGTTPEGSNGARWEAKYNIVGMSTLTYPHFAEGMNDQGLGVGLFYFPQYAVYPEYKPSESGDYLAPWEYATWLLSNFKTVQEVKENADKVQIAPTVLPQWDQVLPLHFFVRDSSGKSLALEYIDGKLQVHDDPIGILTNSPDFDWHVTNLRNYVNLSAINVPKVNLRGLSVGAAGSGSGLLGLPGDFTPPSRFIRATVFTQTALPQENAEAAMTQAFHILNSFDIPNGTVYQKVQKGQSPYEFTQWTTVSDLKNNKFYYHTYGDRRVRMLDMDSFSFEGSQMKSFPITQSQDVEVVK